MQRFAFEIQYHGGAYFGWQRQPKQVSVQEKIEETLQKLFNSQEISIMGCGRTDTGVHAHQSYFHVDLELKFSIEQLKFKMNRMLPPDISVIHIHSVTEDFHARFGAIKRTYRYFIHQEKNPFVKGLSLYSPINYDLSLMNKAAENLIGKQDFTSFSKLHTDVKTNICTISAAKWHRTSESEIYFEITADRFLRNMVRSIVGTLLEVGTGTIEADDILIIIDKQNRSEAKKSVPAHGLFLWKVEYREIGR